MRPLNTVSEELGENIRRHCLGMAISHFVGSPPELLSEERQLHTMGPFYMTHGCELARLDDSGNGLVVLVRYQLDGAPEDQLPEIQGGDPKRSESGIEANDFRLHCGMRHTSMLFGDPP